MSRSVPPYPVAEGPTPPGHFLYPSNLGIINTAINSTIKKQVFIYYINKQFFGAILDMP